MFFGSPNLAPLINTKFNVIYSKMTVIYSSSVVEYTGDNLYNYIKLVMILQCKNFQMTALKLFLYSV